ncbi:hypothetical protein GF352_00710 [archaeon]|nr:hypothetical protein [archaeon]
MKDSKLTLVLVLVSLLIFSFFITHKWFQPDCTLTTHGDLENHFINSLGFQEQLINHGTIFPVTFNYFSLGYYQFSYSPVPFLLPLVLRLFLDARTAFFTMYNLLYALAGFFLFIILRRNKGSLIGSFLFSCLFIASGFMNQQFTVHGSYHTIAAVPLFFLTIIYLQKCVFDKKIDKLNLSLFIIFSALTMATHFFMLIILFVFVTFYLFIKKKSRLWLFFLLSALITSFYYVPLFFQSILLPGSGSALVFNSEKMLNTFLFSLMIPEIQSIDLTAASDYYYGPYFLTTFIIALFYARKSKSFKGKWLFLSLIISLVIVTFLCSTISLLDVNVPFDRVTFFFQMSLFLFSAFVFARVKYGFEVPLLIFILNFLPNEAFLPVFSVLVLAGFFIYFFSKKRLFFNKFTKDYLLVFIAVVISIIPLTLFIPNSLNYPRTWCVQFNDVSFIKSSDVVMFDERLVFKNSLVYLTGAKTVNNIGHTTLLREVPTFEGEELFFEFLNRSGVSKWVYLSKEASDSMTFKYRGIDIDFKAVSSRVEPVPYFLRIINPVSLKVILRESVNNVTLRLNYHPWWRAFSNGQELHVSQDDWFIMVSGLDGLEEFDLYFDTSYFILGWLVTLASLLAISYLVWKQ